MADRNWKDDEVGALWAKTTNNGTKLLSGTINGERVVLFKNKFYEENGNKPMFRVYKDTFEPKAQESTEAETVPDEQDEDIPF